VINMNQMFCGSQFNGDLSQWDISSLKFGKPEIIKFRAKVKEPIKITQSIPEGFEECPVTGDIIEGDYYKCDQCKKCFDIQIQQWLTKNKSCPYCRTIWEKLKIYSQ